ASTAKLKSLGITVFDLNEVDSLGIYVDGADEINGQMQMIKGGGAALTLVLNAFRSNLVFFFSPSRFDQPLVRLGRGRHTQT
ncbi:ribose-5-phosphate isomerase A, partial [Mycobacterium tuberculosis]|nr:ribose-5-phosphate isomerase A [Mycobacterium tuberculosis]